jgi:cob(I)alamin adenosyltransferase
MKVYTKKGDDGSTGLIGGTRVSKGHLRIDSYGTVDELNSWVGLVHSSEIPTNCRDLLIEVQTVLFTIGSHLAADPEKSRMTLPEITPSSITDLEIAMDTMNEELPEMRNFVLPGGHHVVAQIHIARCVCRRAERGVVRLTENDAVEPLILQYLNRLSDYLFVLSRYASLHLNAPEIPWKPSGR